MVTTSVPPSVSTLEIVKEERIAAPLEIVFETLLEQLGPYNGKPPGEPMPMTLEAWPGGRWYRDLGNSTGHLWGHVQVIKPPALLEICGPLFMSYPATSHLQYRLVKEGAATRLVFTHRALGMIAPEHAENVGLGWGYFLDQLVERSQKKTPK